MPTALVVDDNQQMADGLAKILEMLGVQAEVAYGARTGMMKLQRSTPDVIFLDINMPGVDGFEVMAYFRRLPQFIDIPVIIVTSDDQPETAQKAENTGVLTLIVKPVSVESIEKALRIAGVLPW
jgi:chemosensory pili system protein ChpA (sensor histidine kinase/response regulator)